MADHTLRLLPHSLSTVSHWLYAVVSLYLSRILISLDNNDIPDSISLPNYTGSLGYGQRYVEALLGKIGRLDVDEVMASAKEMVKRGLAEEGPGMQLYMGGSHGGFLGAHGSCPSFLFIANQHYSNNSDEPYLSSNRSIPRLLLRLRAS